MWKMKSPGGGPRLESGWWSQAMWIVSTVFRSVESEPARVAGAAPKAAGRAKRCGSCPPLSSPDSPDSPEPDYLEDAPPARQRALKACDGRRAVGLDTSIFRWLVAHRVRAFV